MVPEDYIRKQTLVGGERFITPELKEYEAKVLGSEERLKTLEYQLFQNVLELMQHEAPSLSKTALSLALVNFLASLAVVAKRHNYVKPAIDESGVIEIMDGRHAVLERLPSDAKFIPNSVYLDTEDDRLLIITGPNMAGKSTFMRQTALMVLLAQMGGFVPASEAKIGITDRAGEYRGHGHPHESPLSMTGPLVALAGATVFVGFLGAGPAKAVFFDWVYFEEPELVELVPWIAVVSIAAATIGVVAGYFVYRRWRERNPVLALGPVSTLLANKYYMDTFYWKFIIQPTRDTLSAAANWFNQRVLDGVVDGAARAARAAGDGVQAIDEGVVDGAVNGVGQLAGFTGGLLRYLQSGNVQRYAAFLFAGVVILAVNFTRI